MKRQKYLIRQLEDEMVKEAPICQSHEEFGQFGQWLDNGQKMRNICVRGNYLLIFFMILGAFFDENYDLPIPAYYFVELKGGKCDDNTKGQTTRGRIGHNIEYILFLFSFQSPMC
jgi:hypothetical protein